MSTDRDIEQALLTWRSADAGTSGPTLSNVEWHNAMAEARRARWAYEDAVRRAAVAQGMTEDALNRLHRSVARMAEMTTGRRARRSSETPERRTDRERDEAIIARELGD